MQNHFTKNLLPVKYGILLTLLTLVFGFGLGGAFGAFEDNIKGHLKVKAERVLASVYHGDEAKMKKVTGKSWVYFKRAHLHANGLGAISLALILFISFLAVDNRIKGVNALCLGLGSVGYSIFWMFAGPTAPGTGSTGMAKESLKWLAIPSAGLCIMGLAMVIAMVIMLLFISDDSPTFLKKLKSKVFIAEK